MHIFLQGPRNVGKSTVIRKTLDILTEREPLKLGGFFTWKSGADDPYVYLQSARHSGEKEVYRVAGFDENKGGFVSYIEAFEKEGVRLIKESKDAELIVMDELGYLESGAPKFKKAVLDAVAGDIPIFGVLRLGDVPWHADIKSSPLVSLFDVNEKNRDTLPRELARMLGRIRNAEL